MHAEIILFVVKFAVLHLCIYLSVLRDFVADHFLPSMVLRCVVRIV